MHYLYSGGRCGPTAKTYAGQSSQLTGRSSQLTGRNSHFVSSFFLSLHTTSRLITFLSSSFPFTTLHDVSLRTGMSNSNINLQVKLCFCFSAFDANTRQKHAPQTRHDANRHLKWYQNGTKNEPTIACFFDLLRFCGLLPPRTAQDGAEMVQMTSKIPPRRPK